MYCADSLRYIKAVPMYLLPVKRSLQVQYQTDRGTCSCLYKEEALLCVTISEHIPDIIDDSRSKY